MSYELHKCFASRLSWPCSANDIIDIARGYRLTSKSVALGLHYTFKFAPPCRNKSNDAICIGLNVTRRKGRTSPQFVLTQKHIIHGLLKHILNAYSIIRLRSFGHLTRETYKFQTHYGENASFEAQFISRCNNTFIRLNFGCCNRDNGYKSILGNYGLRVKNRASRNSARFNRRQLTYEVGNQRTLFEPLASLTRIKCISHHGKY